MKWGKRNVVSRRFHAKDDKETIANWKLDLDEILRVVNVRPVTLVKKNVANFPVPEGTCDKQKCNRFYYSSQGREHRRNRFRCPE